MPKTGTILVSDGNMEGELAIEPSLRVANHSPTGFAWGYPGSGPAQTALAILLDYTKDPEKSDFLHQQFKFDFIATMPDEGGKITGAEIDEWLKAKREEG